MLDAECPKHKIGIANYEGEDFDKIMITMTMKQYQQEQTTLDTINDGLNDNINEPQKNKLKEN